MKKIITTAILAIALVAGFGVTSASAATPPAQPNTLTGVATCNSNSTYSIVWTASGYPYNFSITPEVESLQPSDSRFNLLAWSRSSDHHKFIQDHVNGLSTSASATAVFSRVIQGVTYSGPVTGIVQLAGTCASIGTPPTLPAQLHRTFTLYVAHPHRR